MERKSSLLDELAEEVNEDVIVNGFKFKTTKQMRGDGKYALIYE